MFVLKNNKVQVQEEVLEEIVVAMVEEEAEAEVTEVHIPSFKRIIK
jgi:hypothetical protein